MNPTELSVCVSTARQSWLACISEPFAGDGTAQLVPVDVPLSFHPRGSGGTGARQASQVFPEAGSRGDREGAGRAVRKRRKKRGIFPPACEVGGRLSLCNIIFCAMFSRLFRIFAVK